MAFATAVDVVAALGRSLTSDESAAVENQLDQATDLVVGYLGATPDPVPGAVTRVVATMVAAVFTKPATNNSDYGANGYNVVREAMTVKVGVESATTSGPWLTNALKMRLSPYRVGALTVFTVSSEFGS
jgi:cell wall-associated NlpC family hydrolase